MKENECKDVVQRKNHAVEILEVKEIVSLKKDMHQTFVLIHEKYIIFIYCFQHIFTFVSLFKMVNIVDLLLNHNYNAVSKKPYYGCMYTSWYICKFTI